MSSNVNSQWAQAQRRYIRVRVELNGRVEWGNIRDLHGHIFSLSADIILLQSMEIRGTAWHTFVHTEKIRGVTTQLWAYVNPATHQTSTNACGVTNTEHDPSTTGKAVGCWSGMVDRQSVWK